MIRRAARAGAVAAALLLAAHAARSWWAEQAYEAGIWAADPRSGRPATERTELDVPGRLESYDEAARRDPSQPLYALRAGQIRLQRATNRPRPADSAALLAAARASLETAVVAHPLDSDAHVALAHALAAGRDVDGAVRHARAAVRAAPRRISTLEPSASLFVSAWRATSDPDVLADLLETARLGFELADGRDPSLPPLGRVPASGIVTKLLRAETGPTTGDLVFALRGRPELLDTAARLVEATQPEAARTLRGAMRPGPSK